jgi:uncharacterized protein (TIGR01777 family)
MKRPPSKKILISGASGLVGLPLCAELKVRGHVVQTLSRGDGGDFQWDVDSGALDPAALAGVDVVVHLAGESIAQRWTNSAKTRILNSRVAGTRLLVDAILQQGTRPAFISASGISYYGVEREGLVDESSDSGQGFLAEVTRQWEGAAQLLIDSGVRTSFIRTGIVLSVQGGALAKMLPAFKWGLGGRIGSGQQRMSWISLPDLVSIYIYVIENESAQGIWNAVAPESVTNLLFIKTLAQALGRPSAFPFPAVLVKLLLGQMGRETLLSDLGVKPQKLNELGFDWQQPDLEQAFSVLLF